MLQTGEFERLGSSGTRKADVRIVSATNTDLARAIAAGQFREDLYFRLNVIELPLPPLGERPDDVMLLAEHFLELLPGIDGAPPATLSDEARFTLQQYEWPGNVRELQNRIHRAKLTAPDGVIRPQHLGIRPSGARPARVRIARGDRADAVGRPAAAGGPARRAGRPTGRRRSGARQYERRCSRPAASCRRRRPRWGSRAGAYRRMERLESCSSRPKV